MRLLFQVKAGKERDQLIDEVAQAQKERDDLLIEAEMDKQEELRVAASAKASLQGWWGWQLDPPRSKN